MGPQRGNNESFLTKQTALWISGLYFVFSATYIYVSGWLVLRLYSDPADLARVEMYKGWGFILSSSVLLFVVIHIASKALKRSTARQFEAAQQYQRMIETTNEGVWKVDANARTMFINQTMAEMLGVDREGIVGKSEAMFLDEPWSTMAIEHLERQKSGSRDLYECRFRRPDGGDLWAVVAASPMHDADGKFTGVLRMVTDITKRKEMELALKRSLSSQRQLLDELDHRVRNNLTSLISLVDISRRTSDDPDAFASSIRGRIDAMNRAHGLLSSSGWKHQHLAELLCVLIPDVYRSRVMLSGPDVRCAASVSGALAILFHELVSNAVRYGALSVPNGQMEVTWSINSTDADSSIIELHWREHGGPPPSEHVQHSTGLRLVAGLVSTDLHGKADFSFPPEGADHRLILRLDNHADLDTAHEMVSAIR